MTVDPHQAALRDVVVARSTDGQVIAKAKNAAKVVKYLDAWDRLGAAVETAERAAHRLVLEVERLRAEGVEGRAAMARALNERRVPTPQGRGAWTHTTVARVMARSGCA